jgi:uncharacterized membrane protein YphA (DoxX/SURF4 family)
MTTSVERQLLLIIRCTLAVLVSVHGWHRILDDGVMPFAEYMEGRMPLGFYLVFVLQAMELFGSVAFAMGWCVSMLGAIFAIIYGGSIYFYHSQFGWIQSGGVHNGAEYAFALVVCFLAMSIIAWPNPDVHGRFKLAALFARQRSETLRWRILFWRSMGYLVAFIMILQIGLQVQAERTDFKLIADLVSSLFVGHLLVTSIVALQILACVLIVVGRFLRAAYFSLAVLFFLKILIYHAQFGWIVSGADKDGAEYTFLLMVLSSCLFIYHSRKLNT